MHTFLGKEQSITGPVRFPSSHSSRDHGRCPAIGGRVVLLTVIVIVLNAFTFVTTCNADSVGPLSFAIQLESDTTLLYESIWVLLRVTNQGSTDLRVHPLRLESNECDISLYNEATGEPTRVCLREAEYLHTPGDSSWMQLIRAGETAEIPVELLRTVSCSIDSVYRLFYFPQGNYLITVSWYPQGRTGMTGEFRPRLSASISLTVVSPTGESANALQELRDSQHSWLSGDRAGATTTQWEIAQNFGDSPYAIEALYNLNLAIAMAVPTPRGVDQVAVLKRIIKLAPNSYGSLQILGQLSQRLSVPEFKSYSAELQAVDSASYSAQSSRLLYRKLTER